jgi:hypothetical protein
LVTATPPGAIGDPAEEVVEQLDLGGLEGVDQLGHDTRRDPARRGELPATLGGQGHGVDSPVGARGARPALYPSREQCNTIDTFRFGELKFPLEFFARGS